MASENPTLFAYVLSDVGYSTYMYYILASKNICQSPLSLQHDLMGKNKLMFHETK